MNSSNHKSLRNLQTTINEELLMNKKLLVFDFFFFFFFLGWQSTATDLLDAGPDSVFKWIISFFNSLLSSSRGFNSFTITSSRV